MSSEAGINPFRVDIPDEAIADLRRRIAATRHPDLVPNDAAGAREARPCDPYTGSPRSARRQQRVYLLR